MDQKSTDLAPLLVEEQVNEQCDDKNITNPQIDYDEDKSPLKKLKKMIISPPWHLIWMKLCYIL